MAVGGNSFQHLDRIQLALMLQERIQFLLALCELPVVRIYRYIAVHSIQHYGIAMLYLGKDIARADDSRQAHDTGNDGGMAGAAAQLGHKALYIVHIHRGGIGRGQIVGKYHDFLIQIIQRDAHIAHNIVQDTAAYVLNVCRAFAQILVIQGSQHRGNLFRCFRNSLICMHHAVVDFIHHSIFQRGIVEHHQVSAENIGLFSAQAFFRFLNDLIELRFRFGYSFTEFFDLRFTLRRICQQRFVDDNLFLFQYKCFPDCNTRGCNNSFHKSTSSLKFVLAISQTAAGAKLRPHKF